MGASTCNDNKTDALEITTIQRASPPGAARHTNKEKARHNAAEACGRITSVRRLAMMGHGKRINSARAQARAQPHRQKHNQRTRIGRGSQGLSLCK